MQNNRNIWIPQIERENRPLYKEIVRAIRQDISTGALQVGDKMPPQRELAWALDVNPSTIAKAYDLAAQENLISGEVGRGTYIRGGSHEAWLFRLNSQQNHGDLTTISPQMSHDILPDALLPLLASSAWTYIHTDEIYAMEQAIRQWDKLPFTDDTIVLTAGAHYALGLIADNLCGVNDTILCEEFTYPGLISVQNIRPYRLQPVAMDSQGIIPQALEAAIIRYRPKMLTLMSYSQNPTMVNMPTTRQQAIAQVIAHYKLTTVEDDVWGCFRTNNKACLYGLLPKYVLRINSFSKTIAGGVRLGWLRGYHPTLKTIRQSPELSSWMIAPPLMRLLLHWLGNGHAEGLFNQQKAQMQQRFALAQEILGLGKQPLSCYLWLKTKESGSQTAAMLLNDDIKVAPAQLFSPLNSDAPYIRLSLLHNQSNDDLAYMLQKVKGYLL